MAFAFTIRLFVALRFTNVIAIDEIYQYLEQAHRLVFGQGLVPWEYQVGLRNWLIPLLLAVPMWVAHWLFADPLPGLVLIRILLCGASLGIVWCAGRLGERHFGNPGLWVAGMTAALMPDLWLMAPHSLEEVFAADCLVPALYFVEVRAPEDDSTRVALAGFLLGLAFVFRLQLAPAIAVAGIYLCRHNISYWRVALLAGAWPVVAAGMLDGVTWGQPFRSFWLNLDLNLFHGLAAQEFGREPAIYYFHVIAPDWLWSVPVIAIFCWRGAKRLPASGSTAMTILVTHTLLAHKEIRFIFPAIALGAVLAGIGLAETLQKQPAPRGAMRDKFLLASLIAGPFFSPLLAISLLNHNESFKIFESIKSENSKIVAVNDYSGAYLPLDILFLHQTFIEPMSNDDIRRFHPGLILSADPSFMPMGYHRMRCFHGESIRYLLQRRNDTCVWAVYAPYSSPLPAPMVNFAVPPEVRRYEIIDRLFPNELPSPAAGG